MKKHPFKKTAIAAFTIAALGLAPQLIAADNLNKPFFDVGAGVNIMEDVKFKSIGLSLSTDPGARFSFSGGYTFGLTDRLGLAVGGETGFMYNGLKSVNSPF